MEFAVLSRDCSKWRGAFITAPFSAPSGNVVLETVVDDIVVLVTLVVVLRRARTAPSTNTAPCSLQLRHDLAAKAMNHYPYGSFCPDSKKTGCNITTWRAVSPQEEADHPLAGTVLGDYLLCCDVDVL